MSNTTNPLDIFMQAITQAATAAVTSNTEETTLEVEDTSATLVDSIEVILQGQRKQPSKETLAQLVGSGSTFSNLRQQLFQSNTSRGIGVSVTYDGRTTTYNESDRIPGSILDATELRISYSVESGRNGSLVLA